MPSIKLNNGRVFNCTEGETILDGANKSGVILEYSCRSGRCGVCKASVLKGETQTLIQEEYLDEQEDKEGYILTCCREALSNVELDIDDLGQLSHIPVKTLPCRIDGLQLLSSDVIEVFLRIPPGSVLEYVPGQYVDIIGKAGLRRSYSIANRPRGDGKISLQIRKVHNGQMSEYWFDEAQQNDLLRFEGPFGTFFLKPKPVSNLIFLATGTGIAPIKAILEQLDVQADSHDCKKIYVYWGGRQEQDIYWKPSFPNLPITFTPVLSQNGVSAGRYGYVQQAVIDDGIDLKDSVVYACGSLAMIQSAKQQLAEAGLDKQNFYSDAFVSSN